MRGDNRRRVQDNRQRRMSKEQRSLKGLQEAEERLRRMSAVRNVRRMRNI